MNIELARLRKRAGYATQRHFADAFGTSRRNVEDWERGASCPSLFTAARMADFLGCSLDELVGREVRGKAEAVGLGPAVE